MFGCVGLCWFLQDVYKLNTWCVGPGAGFRFGFDNIQIYRDYDGYEILNIALK